MIRREIFRALKLAHFAGLTLFLGSIFTFIALSVQTQGAPLCDLVFARRAISAATGHLTLPGLWVAVIAGVGMAVLREGGGRVVLTKFVLGVLILMNACLLVRPAVNEATSIAIGGLKAGALDQSYKAAFLREEVSGVLNIVLAMTAAVVSVRGLGGNAAASVSQEVR